MADQVRDAHLGAEAPAKGAAPSRVQRLLGGWSANFTQLMLKMALSCTQTSFVPGIVARSSTALGLLQLPVIPTVLW